MGRGGEGGQNHWVRLSELVLFLLIGRWGQLETTTLIPFFVREASFDLMNMKEGGVLGCWSRLKKPFHIHTSYFGIGCLEFCCLSNTFSGPQVDGPQEAGLLLINPMPLSRSQYFALVVAAGVALFLWFNRNVWSNQGVLSTTGRRVQGPRAFL